MAWWFSCLDIPRSFWVLSEVHKCDLLSPWWSGSLACINFCWFRCVDMWLFIILSSYCVTDSSYYDLWCNLRVAIWEKFHSEIDLVVFQPPCCPTGQGSCNLGGACKDCTTVNTDLSFLFYILVSNIFLSTHSKDNTAFFKLITIIIISFFWNDSALFTRI